MHAKIDTDDLEFASGNLHHKKQTSGLEQIVIWQDGETSVSSAPMTFNDSGHVTDAWWD